MPRWAAQPGAFLGERKFEALINVGEERHCPRQDRYRHVLSGPGPSRGEKGGRRHRGRDRRVGQQPRGHGPVGALRQGKSAVPPVCARDRYDSARRLWELYKVRLTEVWTYRPAAEGFDLVRMWHDAAAVAASTRAANASARAESAAKSAPAGKAAASRQTARCPQTRGRDVQKTGREACEARKNGEARLHEGCQAGESPRERGQKACEEGHARLTQEVGLCRSSAIRATSAATKVSWSCTPIVRARTRAADRGCCTFIDLRRT